MFTRLLATARGLATATLLTGPGSGTTPTPAVANRTVANRTVATPADQRIAGVYRLERINGRPLPASERLVGAAGYELVGRVDRVLLNLHSSGRFTVDVHYQYAHVLAGTRVPLGDSWSDADARGTWTVRAGALTLLPDPSRKGRAAPPLLGSWRGDRIVMDLRYAGRYTGGQERQYVVRLARAPEMF